MLKRLFDLIWCYTKPSLVLLLTALLFTPSPPAQAENRDKVPQFMPNIPTVTSSEPSIPVSNSVSDITQPVLQVDPLNSPHPIPWNWVIETYSEFSEKGSSGLGYYRSSSLVSPDGNYAAYSRIKMKAEPELFRSNVSSVMFLENLRTGDLKTITASSPLADNPFKDNEEADQPGAMAILMPVSWSQSGDRILARQFEGFFSTSDASDYAVVWDRQENHTSTISPNQIDYTNAVLLGWSKTNPEQVLFRAGPLGDEQWPIWSVAINGETAIASEDKPIVYGQRINQVWTGPQARW